MLVGSINISEIDMDLIEAKKNLDLLYKDRFNLENLNHLNAREQTVIWFDAMLDKTERMLCSCAGHDELF